MTGKQMLTLETYVEFLRSKGSYTVNVIDLLNDFNDAKKLIEFVELRAKSIDYVISVPAMNEMFADRKIQAIKIIRAETNLGLKESKDICDAFMLTDRYKNYKNDRALAALREKLTGNYEPF